MLNGDSDVLEASTPAPATEPNHRPRGRIASARKLRGPAATTLTSLTPLATITPESWRELAARAAEPNGYFLPEWVRAVNAFARGRTDISALDVWNDTGDTLIGLMPAASAWRAYKLPLPAFVTADIYPPLGTPLLYHDRTDEAAGKLMQRARALGARALILRDITLDGPVMQSFTRVLGWNGLRPRILQHHARAALDATKDAEELLHEALGPKRLKELRRQRNRLAETGEVVFTIAATPDDIVPALEVFLRLEASGWKARRGTALMQDPHDLAFIRRAVNDMAARGQCEVVSLYAGGTPIAAAILLRHQDRAFYFKLGIDERFAKFSPGVQLTLDLTRHLCADETISLVDSTAAPNHPMIDPIWRGRLAIGDVLIPLHRRDPVIGAIRLALDTRRAILRPTQRIVRLIRKIRDKRP